MSSRGHIIGFHRGKNGKGGRLFVGVRERNFHPVYYEPIGEPDENGETGIGLYAKPTGSIEHEPMLGEVLWNYWYKVEKDESKIKIERDIIQRQDLYIFWKYLETKDEDEAKALEDRITKMGMKRQNGFLKVAKDWRKVDTRTRAATRARRERKAERAGIPADQAEINSDASDDSAYESDEEEQQERVAARKRRARDAMPPPPGRPSNKRRKGRANADGGRNRTDTPDGRSDSPMFMSGGRGARDSSSVRRDRSVNVLTGRLGSEDSDFDFDPRPPQSDGGFASYNRADSPMENGGGLDSSGYVCPTVETATDDSEGDEALAAQRRIEAVNGVGLDEEAALNQAIRESSQAHQEQDLDHFGGQFGGGQETDARQQHGRQGGRSLNGDRSSNIRSPSGRSPSRGRGFSDAAQAASQGWGGHTTSPNPKGANGNARQQSNGASRAVTEQSDSFDMRLQAAGDRLSSEELNRMQRGSVIPDSNRTEAPVQEDDGDGAGQHTTPDVNGTHEAGARSLITPVSGGPPAAVGENNGTEAPDVADRETGGSPVEVDETQTDNPKGEEE